MRAEGDRRTGHSVGVLHRVYAKCIAGKEDEDMRRILEATQPNKPENPRGA